MLIRERTVSRIKWQRPGNDWKLLVMDNGEIWKGKVGDVTPGTLLKAQGREVPDKFGLAFEVETLLNQVVSSADGLEAWIVYRLPEIGERRAADLKARFGEQLFDVIKLQPEKLTEVIGITGARAQEIREAYLKYEDEQVVVSGLVDLGLSMHLSLRAYKECKPEGVLCASGSVEAVLAEDPYAFMDVQGITFDAIDVVAKKLGMDLRDPRRLCAWVRAMLEAELEQGHCYIEKPKLYGTFVRWGFDIGAAEEILKNSSMLSTRSNAVLLKKIDFDEHLASEAIKFNMERGLTDEFHGDKLPDWLDSDQLIALRGILEQPVSVLTGGAGTGKTATLKAALDIMEEHGMRVALAAPTGKAAKRMSEVTGRPASTVHKLLKWTKFGWGCTATTPVEADVVVIDEASMVDIELFSPIAQAVVGKLLFVGDPNQLPPVGPGQPFADLIQSGVVPVFRLTQVHRQTGDSWVIDNAPGILKGRVPKLENSDTFEMVETRGSSDILETVTAIYEAGERPQVLTPEHKNGAGTFALNKAVQLAINPRSSFDLCLSVNGYKIYEADRVLYTRNAPELNLVNGDVGVVQSVRHDGYKFLVSVLFDGFDDAVLLEGGQAGPLTLAYALTVHKAQGSEFPLVIVVADEEHSSFRRQLLYTAVTRTRDQLVIVGSKKALEKAVAKPLDTTRRTLLVERLKRV